ncbi:TnsD family transposase [Microbulbifer sp. OS29]|uniref:TnsD family transposase n=1 Tax=Microbulbifer okhotskensis TaxID=2926617 RepID=A0A9X2EQJ3_9GAMM|nr:TnsD family Tn7-like transposition protein [Microbulbifer okhotskensis]MCO1336619.1 TnsD family transposase [Microbulbifer okhotskensis]
MLGYFPTLYKDELLYSAIARYALHTGQENSQKAVLRDVFSSRTATAIPDLPSHLNALVQNLSTVWSTTVDNLIGTYTLAPIYLPFLSEEQARSVKQSMTSDIGGNIHTRVGITASSIKQLSFFRYCSACMTDQLALDGEAYWQRSHQLQGLDFCKKHSCLLNNSEVSFHPKEKHHFFTAAASCSSSVIRKLKLHHNEKVLNDKYLELLEEPFLDGFGANRWTMFYHNLAHDLGFIEKNRIQYQKIYLVMKQVWKGSIFEKYFIEPIENHWLKNIFRKHRKSFHPLRHLLVITALAPDISITQILSKVKNFSAPSQDSNTMTNRLKGGKSEEVKQHRQLWLNFLDKHKSLGIKNIRKTPGGGALYSWLYRNDYQWLMNNRPKYRPENQLHYKADCREWDKYNVITLNKIHKDLSFKPKRCRLTKTFLLKNYLVLIQLKNTYISYLKPENG